ncbi:uncharacterized protein PV06_00541 [Exophiala oligosperma]|uniref:Uncharacterized protein n=2 Tax=Chaetothyriales TaxID=34395 RepID=A0A0D2DZ72_9EURO|nr:uncharacterized protein PV06_00541 [Exophiala oligosperma]KAJ9626846.1 hypothetical protein H2204_009862 [Knufia peltigerae]KIW47885.1 hypothetical protein PV06_00541 [Exophiala oligosperma]
MLREDYIRKVSEYWKRKLNTKILLLIEDITIGHRYSGRGIDTQMLKALLRATQDKVEDTFLAITWPESDKTTRFCETFEILVGSSGTTRVPDPVDPKFTTCFRELGFRHIESSIWFGLVVRTSEVFHRPRTLDHYFDPLPRLRPKQELPGVILATFGMFDDSHMLQIFKIQYGQLAPDSEQWLATDIWGNTILHLAAQLHYPKCVGWILEHGSRHLPHVCNMNRDTPLHALELAFEKSRSRCLQLPS